jgi:hypothetical protein
MRVGEWFVSVRGGLACEGARTHRGRWLPFHVPRPRGGTSRLARPRAGAYDWAGNHAGDIDDRSMSC